MCSDLHERQGNQGNGSQIPEDLIEAFAQGDGAIFVGEQLSMSAGLPGREQMKECLLQRMADCPPDSSFEEVAGYYENMFGRIALIKLLRELLLPPNWGEPTTAYDAIAQLRSNNMILTTNYDKLLEKTLEKVGRSSNFIVDGYGEKFYSYNTLQLIKVYGDLMDVDTIVATSSDYDQYSSTHKGVIAILDRLQTHVVLFIGYGDRDADMYRFLARLRERKAEYSRNFYIILFDPFKVRREDLERRGVKVIDLGKIQPNARNQVLTDWFLKFDRAVEERHKEQRKAAVQDSSTDIFPQRKHFSEEVKELLRVMRFEISNEISQEGRVLFLATRVAVGETINRWYLCLEAQVALQDIQFMEECLQNKPGSKGWIITLCAPTSTDEKVREMLMHNPAIESCTLALFYPSILGYGGYLHKLIESAEEVERYWVKIDCTQRGSNFDLVDFVDRWLQSRAQNHLVLFGEFGTGKTWFCKYYAARLARLHKKDPEHYRIPILIPLQGYTRSIKIEQVITDTLVNTYHIDLPGGFETFMHLNRTGHLLLIFDGFDEMERRATLEVAESNLANILRIVVDDSKVLLTSRALFFEEGKALPDVLRHPRPQGAFEILYMLPFGDTQIYNVLSKRLPDEKQLDACWERVLNIRHLHNLATRPVMVDIISKTVPIMVKEGNTSQLNAATLYMTFVKGWIEKACRGEDLRDKQEEVLEFLHDLAWRIFCTQATGTITPSEFRQAVETRFRNNLSSSVLEELFVRDKATNNYTFPHISFAEYFVADKVMIELTKGEVQSFFECASVEGTMEFLIDLATVSHDQLSLLYTLFVAETAQQVDRAMRLLRGVKKDKLFQFLLDVLNEIHLQGMNRELPTPTEKIGLLSKIQERLEAGMSKHVVEALGREEFLNEITAPIQQMPSLVRRFLFELFQSPHIEAAHILEELKQAIYQDPDIHLRLLAVHVLIQKKEKEGFPVLVETIGSRQAPVELRKACVKELQASTDDLVRGQVLTMLHKVIGDNRDDLSFRRECITLAAEHNTQEALLPLVNILKDFDHELFYFCADTLQTRACVPSIANAIEEQIIASIEEASARRTNLVRPLALLHRTVAAIRQRSNSGC